MALEKLRVTTRLFRQKGDNTPRASMGRMYRETRKIARICSADMMYGLVELACNAEDERVRMMSMMAVLDRGGIMPSAYDPQEDIGDINSMPLAEKRERLKLLIARAREIIQHQDAPPGLSHSPGVDEGSAE